MKNAYTVMLDMMDRVFATPDKQRSKVRKINQYFDKGKGENVIILEYRYFRGDTPLKGIKNSNNVRIRDSLLQSIIRMPKKKTK